jgi:hypothetical protein
LKEGLTQHEIKKGQLHKVFEDSFDPSIAPIATFRAYVLNVCSVSFKAEIVDDRSVWEDYEHTNAVL